MAQKAVMRPHARYVAPPPRPPRAPSVHAAPMEPVRSVPTPARPSRPAVKRTGARRSVAVLLCVNAALAAATIVAVWSAQRSQPVALHGAAGAYVLPALVVGTILVLLRSHASLDGYRRLRQRARHGRGGGHWTDQATALLFGAMLCGTVLLAAALLAWAESDLVALLAT